MAVHGSLSTTETPGGSIGISFTPSAVRSWSSVSDSTWAALGFWTILGLAAIAFLVVCLMRRQRFDDETPPRVLMSAAIVLFSLYAGYHLILFAREYIS
jgi:hypothetical protein